MIRLFLFVLIVIFFFIVYYIIKTLFRANQVLRSGKQKRSRSSRFKDIEEADYKEIETNRKNDKDVQE